MRDLERKETFIDVPKTKELATQTLPLLWVFKYKFDTNGFLTKFKARLCVRGDLQTADQDTYAATLAARTFRALMAIAAAFDLEIRHYDAVYAFTNSKLDEKIYCDYPEGFERLGKCLLLLRALYGLKRSPLLWYTDFTTSLEELGLQPVPGVNCLYTNDRLIVFFFVDDIVILCLPIYLDRLARFETRLLNRYEMRSLGDLKWFLGIRIERDRPARKLWLCQDSYIDKIATKFHCDKGKSPGTPLQTEELHPSSEDQKATAQQILAYQQRVGSLNFAAVVTRPDIARAASKLSEYLQNPSPTHLSAADRVISYLYGTKTLAIEYSGRIDSSNIFICSADAAFADDMLTRRSSDGYLFQLYGGPIDWRAAKQKTVTTSSTEAELLSLSFAVKEVMWWKRLFASIQFDMEHPLSINCDNLQTIRLLKKESPRLETKLRHVDIHQHWLRQEVSADRMNVSWTPTNDMPADGLTKALPRQRHEMFVRQLNLVDIKDQLDIREKVLSGQQTQSVD
jgi:hypothetical protein